MGLLEKQFESHLVTKLQKLYPGAYIIKNNPNYIQGFPDRLFLFGEFWAAFDTKKSINSPVRPNQKHYIRELNKMSFARFVSPETEEEFLYELQRALES